MLKNRLHQRNAYPPTHFCDIRLSSDALAGNPPHLADTKKRNAAVYLLAHQPNHLYN
jgi:hypothetical protein